MHLGDVAEAIVDLGKAADRGEIFGSGAEDGFELFPRRLVIAHFNQGASERHAGGEIRGMTLETDTAGFDRLLVVTDAAVFLREGRERNRRRVRLDPASQFL